MRVFACSSKQSRPEKLLLPRKHALLYSFPSFLTLYVDSVIHVGAICSMRAGLLGFLSLPVPQQPASNKEKSHTGLHKVINWLTLSSGYLLALITYVTPPSLSMLATWAQYLSQCDSLRVASSVVCAGMAEEVSSSLALSYSHCPASTSCLVDPPILPAWPISILLKYMIDRIQTIFPHQMSMPMSL